MTFTKRHDEVAETFADPIRSQLELDTRRARATRELDTRRVARRRNLALGAGKMAAVMATGALAFSAAPKVADLAGQGLRAGTDEVVTNVAMFGTVTGENINTAVDTVGGVLAAADNMAERAVDHVWGAQEEMDEGIRQTDIENGEARDAADANTPGVANTLARDQGAQPVQAGQARIIQP